MISWIKSWFKRAEIKPAKVERIIRFDDYDKVKQLEPIYKPGYICTAKDCKCDNKCKEIIGWREK